MNFYIKYYWLQFVLQIKWAVLHNSDLICNIAVWRSGTLRKIALPIGHSITHRLNLDDLHRLVWCQYVMANCPIWETWTKSNIQWYSNPNLFDNQRALPTTAETNHWICGKRHSIMRTWLVCFKFMYIESSAQTDRHQHSISSQPEKASFISREH